MSDKNENKPAAVNQPVKAKGVAPVGKIIFNKYLDQWQAVNKDGQILLSSGKQAVIDKFPDFTVEKE